tara:strand:- start:597 stop:950 length:354 start_codon:yes stop_codon:yes gene_type:complete
VASIIERIDLGCASNLMRVLISLTTPSQAVEYTPVTSDIVTQAFIEHFCRAYKMDHDGYHGFYHWMRVLQNCRHLAKAENANIIVVELFALLHDTQRQNEDDDSEHGLRGEQFAQTF